MSIFADIGRVSAGMNKAESDRLALAEAQFMEQERNRIAMEQADLARRMQQDLSARQGTQTFGGAGLQPRVNERASGVASTTQQTTQQQTTQQQSTQPQTTQQQATQQQAPAQGQPTAGAMPQSAREREAAAQAAPAAQGEAQPTQQAGVRPPAQQDVPLSEQVITPEQAERVLRLPPGTNIDPKGMNTLRNMASQRGINMAEVPLDAGFRTASNYIQEVSGQPLTLYDVYQGLGSPLADTAATQRQQARMQGGAAGKTAAFLASPVEGLLAMGEGPTRFIGDVGEQLLAPGLDFAGDVGSQLISPGEQPATEQPAAEAAPQQAGVSEGVSNIEQKAPEAAASSDPQVTKQAVESDVTPSGVKTTKAWEKSDFYLANQDAIATDIPYMQRQRRIAQFLAESHIINRNFEAAAEAMSGIVGIDQGMIAAQGMLAINQLQEANDPRMLSKMLSYQSGTDTVLVPNLDGTYDVERGGRVTASGIGRDQIAQQAKLSIDSGARQAAAETNMLFQKEAIKARFEMLVQGQKIEGDLLKVLRQGANELEVKTLEAQIKERGFDLISASPDGRGLVIEHQGQVFTWTGPIAGEEPGFFGSLFGAKGTPSYPGGLLIPAQFDQTSQ